MADSAKGNPASHRMNNPKLKDRRAKSWASGQKRKAALTVQVAEQEHNNKRLRNLGVPTQWEFSKIVRAIRRGTTATLSDRLQTLHTKNRALFAGYRKQSKAA